MDILQKLRTFLFCKWSFCDRIKRVLKIRKGEKRHMTMGLLLIAVVIFLCIGANRVSAKIGMPALLLFMGLGMLFGSDGLFKISFEDYVFTERICFVALIFIIFYGGFGTKWDTAKPVAVKSLILSTAGTLLTALLTCGFCHYLLKMDLLESFLIGAVISSTDAASVFSILRSKNLDLKYGTASMLELESGSNDPIAYMLTIMGLAFLKGENVSAPLMLFTQIFYGVIVGVLAYLLGSIIMEKTTALSEGFDTIFVIALVLLAYAGADYLQGNGFLSVYITGILMGNQKFKNKISLVHFFDALTGMAQIAIFFLLGLLSFPHKILPVLPIALAIALALTLIIRPIAVTLLLKPLGCGVRQCLLVSFAGLRGAASIVFAIMAISRGANIEHDLYHIVFCVSLFSVAVQGSLLPLVSKKLDMIEEGGNILKTFNDYQEESAITMIRFYISEGHSWVDKKIQEVNLPPGSLALMIKRDSETIIPKGDTVIKAEDSVILSVPEYESTGEVSLKEIKIDRYHNWNGKTIADLNLPENILIAMLKRGEETIIPRGKTMIHENDIVVIYD